MNILFTQINFNNIITFFEIIIKINNKNVVISSISVTFKNYELNKSYETFYFNKK